MPVAAAFSSVFDPVLANGPAPGDHRATLIAALWCFGSLIVAGFAWAVLRAVRDRRLAGRAKVDLGDAPRQTVGPAGTRGHAAGRPHRRDED